MAEAQPEDPAGSQPERFALEPGPSGRASHDLQGPLSQDFIGRGANANVYRVRMLLRAPSGGERSVDMAMKVFKPGKEGEYDRAGEGYELLRDSYERDDPNREKLVRTYRFDEARHRIFLTLLSGRRVVSFNQNLSEGRTELRREPLERIPNFDAFLDGLLDDLERRGERGVVVPEDAYFLLVGSDGSLDWRYADFEEVTRAGSPARGAVRNLVGVLYLLRSFLDEAVIDGFPYRDRAVAAVRRRVEAILAREPAARDDTGVGVHLEGLGVVESDTERQRRMRAEAEARTLRGRLRSLLARFGWGGGH